MAGEPISRGRTDSQKPVSVKETHGPKIREAMGKSAEPLVAAIEHVERNADQSINNMKNEVNLLRTEITSAEGKADAAIKTAEDAATRSEVTQLENQFNEFEQALLGATSTLQQILQSLNARIMVTDPKEGKRIEKKLEATELVPYLINEIEKLKFAIASISQSLTNMKESAAGDIQDKMREAFETIDEKYDLLVSFILKQPYEGEPVTSQSLKDATKIKSYEEG